MVNVNTKIDVEKDIRTLVAEVLETEPESIKGDANFVKDFGIDSMMAWRYSRPSKSAIASLSLRTLYRNLRVSL